MLSRAVLTVALSACSFNTGAPPPGVIDGQAQDPPFPDAGEGASVDAMIPDDDRDPGPDAGPNTLFYDGFELGPGAWTGVLTARGDRVSRTELRAHTGLVAAHCATNEPAQAQASPFIDLKLTRVHVRVFVLVPATNANTDYVGLIGWANLDGGHTNIGSIDLYPGNRVTAWNNVGENFYDPGVSITPNEWHQIDAHIGISTNNGTIRLAVDGVEVVADSGLDTGELPVTRTQVGIVWQGNPTEPTTVVIDDVSVHDRAF